MNYTNAYRVLYYPRYEVDADADGIGENLLAQSTLLNVLRYLFVGRGRCGVELRWVVGGGDRAIRTYLLLGPVPAGEGDAVLERMLPSEYGWRRMARPDGGRGPLPDDGGPWFETHLLRRVEFMNLPGSMSRLYDLPAGGAELPIDGRVLPSLLPLSAQNRVREYHRRQVCVPVLGPLADPAPDRRRVCEELLYAAPVMLSVILGPPDPTALEADRVVAGTVRRWADPFLNELTGAGFAHGRHLAATYDRYSLPPNNLCRLSVRAAARDPGAAVTVLQSFAGHLGGLRSFDVTDPVVVTAPTTGLGFPAGYDGTTPEGRLRADGVEVEDEEYLGFIGRMGVVYSVEEAGHFLRLPYGLRAGLPGIETRPVPPFYPPPVRPFPAGDAPPPDEVRVGLYRTSPLEVGPADGGPADWHAVRVADLARHALIVGTTGSGKTVTTTLMLRELDRLGVPFVVLEPVKTEYFDRLDGVVPGLTRRRLEGAPDGRPAADFLDYDPMRLMPNVSVVRHVSYLKAAFQAAFPLDDVLSLVLETGLRAYYTRPRKEGGCGLGLYSRGGVLAHRVQNPRDGRPTRVSPSLFDFRDFFIGRFIPAAFDPGGRGGEAAAKMFEWQQIFRRRFDNLLGGPVGTACARADARFGNTHSRLRGTDGPIADALTELTAACFPFLGLLDAPTVIELDAVADNEQKALLMAFLMSSLYEVRQAADLARREAARAAGGRAPSSVPLSHVWVIEEAHRLLSRDATGGGSRDRAGADARSRAVGLFVDMLAEIRAYGQGLVVVEQIPTKLVPETVKNTNLKVMLRLAAADDREFLGTAMHFTPRQQDFVTTLRTGQAVVFDDRLDHPALVTVPPEASWGRFGLAGQNPAGGG